MVSIVGSISSRLGPLGCHQRTTKIVAPQVPPSLWPNTVTSTLLALINNITILQINKTIRKQLNLNLYGHLIVFTHQTSYLLFVFKHMVETYTLERTIFSASLGRDKVGFNNSLLTLSSRFYWVLHDFNNHLVLFLQSTRVTDTMKNGSYGQVAYPH